MATGALPPTLGSVIPFPFHATDIAARHIVARSLRAAIADLVDLLDRLGPDADDEPDGDEEDGSGSAEEDMELNAWGAGDGGAGDPTDAEDDDPGGGNVEDEGEGIDEREPEDAVLVEVSDRAAHKEHLERIRRTRCWRTYYTQRVFRNGKLVLERVPDGWALPLDPYLTRRSLLRGFKGWAVKPDHQPDDAQ